MKTIEVFKRHIKYIHKCKKDYIYLFYIINTLCATIIPFLTLFFTRYIIDSIGLFSFNEILIKLVIIISILLLLTIITIYSNMVSSAIFISLRVNEFKFTTKLYMDMDFKYVEDSKFNDKFFLCTRCLNGDNNGFQGLFNQVYILLPLVMQVLVYTILLGIFNPLIVLLVLLSFTISLSKEHLISRYLSKFLKKNEKHYKHLDNLFNTTFNEKYAKDIRLFGINRLLRKKYKEEVDSINSYSSKCEIRDFYYSLVDLLFVFIRDALAYYIVIKAYLDNVLSIGNLTLYLGFIVGMSQVLRTIANESKRLNKQIVELKEYYGFLEEYNFVTNKGELKAIDKKLPLEIEFKNVCFKYPGSEKYVLNDLSFKIYKGEKLAIIGDNGAGKSTIIKLISGLYEPTSGEILINGINQKEFDKYEYYNMFSTVFQDVNVYPGTIIENVCGTDKSKEARNKAIDALTKVGLEEKINSLPKGYDTDLTHVFEEDGINLSGGETQKLCIARALYKDSNVVILDEPTSALDALAEASIYESFSSLVLNKTAIYISHRLSSTKFCDHIALFTKDGLIEYGNHESLMDKKGAYYEMFMIQGKYYKEGGLNEE